MLSNADRLIAGDEYVVTYDGVEYFCTSIELWGSDRFIGDLVVTWGNYSSDYIFPFCIEDWNSNPGPAVYARDNSQHSIKIEHLELLTSGTTLVPKTVTANGTYDPEDDDADGYSEVTVALPAGTAGTPTATKGTVSNHSVSVTPSVTNTAGMISGGTINGTPVTVSASELVSGSETKTANGTYDVTNLASLVVNVSGGGGASNIASGTFRGTTTGAAMDVPLNYSGSGYPVAVVIYPTGGAYNSSAPSGSNAYNWYNLVKRYSVAVFTAVKTATDQVPFQGMVNKATTATVYKNSSSNATSYQRASSMEANTFGGNSMAAQSSNSVCVVFKSATTMSVFIASTSYGFAANIEYTYHVLYSS